MNKITELGHDKKITEQGNDAEIIEKGHDKKTWRSQGHGNQITEKGHNKKMQRYITRKKCTKHMHNHKAHSLAYVITQLNICIYQPK